MKNIKINHLPTLTWNKNLVNFANVNINNEYNEEPVAEYRNREEIVKQSLNHNDFDKMLTSISGGRKRETYIAGKVSIYNEQDFQTGMGAEFEEYLKENTNESYVLEIEENKKYDKPVLIKYQYPNKSSKVGRYLIKVGENSDVTYIINHYSDRDAEGLNAISSRFYLEKGAKFKLIVVNLLGKNFTRLDDIGVIAKENASFELVSLELGGLDTYSACLVDLREKNAKFYANTGYMEVGEESCDMNYVAISEGKKTESKINVKGVLRDKAKKTFRGTIDFRTGSKGSIGDEQEDVLLLSDSVINKTVPVILCEEEDMDGRHGATIGRLDEETLFYFKTRGIDEIQANKIITIGRLNYISKMICDEEIECKINDFIENVMLK